MANKVIWCAHIDCGVAQPVNYRSLRFCPACKRDSEWLEALPKGFATPLCRWELTPLDKKFLKVNRIASEP